MGKIIRRIITITITESWTIVWAGHQPGDPAEDLPTTGEPPITVFLEQKEQTNEPQESEFPAAGVDTPPSAPAPAGAAGADNPEPGCLPADPGVAGDTNYHGRGINPA